MSLRSRLLRLLWAGPVALAVCYFALWACAPVLTQPPPAPIADDRNREIGLAGGSAIELGPDDPCRDGLLRNTGCNGPQLQAYYRSRVGKVELAAVAHGGQLSFFGGGLLVRGWLYERDRFRLGLDGSLGWLWAGVGLPVSGALTDGVWLYTDPTVSMSAVGMIRVPVGLSFDVGKGVGLGVESGAMTGIDNLVAFPYASLRISAAF